MFQSVSTSVIETFSIALIYKFNLICIVKIKKLPTKIFKIISRNKYNFYIK